MRSTRVNSDSGKISRMPLGKKDTPTSPFSSGLISGSCWSCGGGASSESCQHLYETMMMSQGARRRKTVAHQNNTVRAGIIALYNIFLIELKKGKSKTSEWDIVE